MHPDWIMFRNIRSSISYLLLTETTSHLLMAYVKVISTSDALQYILLCNDNIGFNSYVCKKGKGLLVGSRKQQQKAALLLNLLKSSHLNDQQSFSNIENLQWTIHNRYQMFIRIDRQFHLLGITKKTSHLPMIKIRSG